MKRNLRSTDVEGCCGTATSTFKWVTKLMLLVPVFVMWGLTNVNAQESDDCDPFLSIECPVETSVACDQTENLSLTGTPSIEFNVCGNDDLVNSEFSDQVIPGGSACSYTIIRTWVVSVGDLVETCTQSISVIDNVGPMFSPLENVSVQCVEDVVAPEVTASDACSEDVDIISFESHTAGVVKICTLTTPQGPGPDGSLWLFGAAASGNAASDWWQWTGNPTLTVYDDGTAHLQGNVVNLLDVNQGWAVSVWLENRANWATWSGLGRWYKNDLGLAGNNYLNWDYYELVSGFSNLTGTGSYAGNILYLSHQPSNYFFGWQCGIGANNRNANEGLSGWFFYNGWFNGEWVNGHGDIFTNKSCVPVTPEGECEDEFTYFFRAVDACGNQSFTSQVVSVEDTIAPEFVDCPAGFEQECDIALPEPAMPSATDNCDDEVTILYLGETTSAGEGCDVIVTRTWAAEDDCGNRTLCIQEIVLIDTTAPEFTFVPEAATYECDEDVVYEDATATDVCHPETVSIEVSVDTIAGNCPNNYTIVRTFTANDGCGNSSTATQNITVQDTTAPEFNEFEPYVMIECDELDEYVAPTATDNCGEVTVTLEEELLNSGGCLGVLERHYVATDECGNSTEAVVFIALQDTTAPVVENPADFTVECDVVPAQPEVPVSDNCEGVVTVVPSSVRIDGECENSYTLIWTWTATDYCENVTVVSTTVTVQDTTNPILSEVPADVTISCEDEIPAVQLPIGTDNCDDEVEVSHTDMITPGECPNEYVITRMFRGFDNCGNQAMAVQYITVVDDINPTVEGVEALTFECDEDIVWQEPSYGDSCGDATISFVDETISEGDCFSQYARIYTVTDACGNTATFTQVATVVDTTAPSFEGSLVEINRPCDDYLGNYVVVDDNCNEFEVTFEDDMVSGGCQGRVIRTYTAIDACQNASTFMQIITLTDEIDPTFEVLTEQTTYECGDEFSTPVVVFSDNCDEEVEVSTEVVDTEVGCPRTITYTFTGVDNCGNDAVAVVVYTIVDTTAPEVIAPQGNEFSCDEDVVYGSATATDVCSDVTITFADDTIAGDCPNRYEIVRTWFGTDACGNVGEATTSYFIFDNTAPEFDEYVAEYSIECSDDLPVYQLSASDNCEGEVTITPAEEIIPGSCINEYTIVRTYTATDACGNSSQAVVTINVNDTTAPEISGQFEINRPCDDYAGIFVEASDNCEGDVTITAVDDIVSGGCQGRVIRVYTATDVCGNSSEFTQFITLTDEIDPTFEVLTEQTTYECGDEFSTPVVVFSDNCDEEVEVSTEVVDTEVGCPRTITYTFTGVDNCGNDAVAVVVYTIVDTTAPEVIAPQGNEFSCDEDVVYGSATATDVCSDVTITFADDTIAGDCPNRYEIVRTWFGTDACGNVGEATTSYFIFDDSAPEFDEYVAEYTIECSDELPVYQLSASDNCEGEVTITPSEDIVPGSCINEYTIVRTYTATDACGNSSLAVVTINVNDTTGPEISGQFEITRPCDDYEGIFIEASDNCEGDVTITSVDDIVSGGCQGRVIRIYTATDVCGNSSVFTQFITLTDEVAPTMEVIVGATEFECGDEYSAPVVNFSDNCDTELELASSVEVSDGICPQTITYSFSATDNCGNTADTTIVYTIVDTTAPVWNGEGFETTISCGTAINLILPTATDVCSGDDVTVSSSMEVLPGTCPSNYTEVYTYIATDVCGNASEPLVISVTYVDEVAPEWTSEVAGGPVSCDDVEDIVYEVPSAFDFCSEFEISTETDIIEGSCPSNYTIVKTYTAIDECGNVSEPYSVFYNVFDLEAPVFETELSDLSFECPVEIVPVDVVVTDNCSTFEVTTDVETIWSDECGNGYFFVSYVAVDACGNSSETGYYVNIYDETAPVLSEEPANLVLDCSETLPEAPVVTATDNCGEIIEVDYTETFVGEQPTPGAIADCNILTPELPTPNSCNYPYDWAMALFAMPSAHRYYQVAEGSFVQFEDRIEVTATMVNAANPANGFFVNVTFTNPMTWEEWSNQSFPTGFKADCGGEDANFADWMYYLLQAGEGAELVGFGAYEGSAINLVHAPANNYFGFQYGNGANNYNGADNGFGGWFTYNGVFLVNGSPIMSGNAAGAGDFAFELDCCPDYEVVRTWTATDCTGNTVVHTQTISWEGTTAPGTGGNGETAPIANEETNGNVGIVAVFPNPSNVSSEIKFTSEINNQVMVDVIDLTGRVVAKLYDGRVVAGEVYKVTLNTAALNNGIYQVRMISNNAVSTKQLQIMK